MLSTIYSYTKALLRPSTEYLTLLYNHFTRTENTERISVNPPYLDLFYNYFRHPIEIIDGIYLGNIINASNYEQLKEYDFNVIYNVTKEHACYFPDYFEYHQIDVSDIKNAKITANGNFQEAVLSMAENKGLGKKILVHCHHGRSRSVSLIMAYLMMYHPDIAPDFDTAYSYMKKIKPVINMNLDFADQLREMFRNRDDIML